MPSYTDSPSITKQPVFRPEMTRDVTMEDIIAAQGAFYTELEKRGLHFASVENDDKFFESHRLFLEESFNWPDYNSYN